MTDSKALAPIVRQVLLGGFMLAGTLGFSAAATAAMFERGFYMGLGYGEYDQDSNINAGSSPNNKTTRIFAGYSVLDWLSAEIGYADFSKISYDLGGGVSDTFEPKSGYARANFQIPLYREEKMMVAISLSGGAHQWDVKESFNDPLGTSSTQRSKGTGALYGAGVLLRSRNTALRLEYEVFSDIDKESEIDIQLWSANLLFYF